MLKNYNKTIIFIIKIFYLHFLVEQEVEVDVSVYKSTSSKISSIFLCVKAIQVK